MYRIISLVAFAVTFAGIALNCIVSPCACCKEYWRHPLKRLVGLFSLLLIKRKSSPLDVLRKLVYLLALLCFVVLSITGFYPILVLGEHISGYLVMVHVTFAPVFAVCLAVLAVMWAGKCCFKRGDCPVTRRLVEWFTGVKGPEEEAARESFGVGQKVFFWLIIVLALPLTLSIILSMFPLFGTHWQDFSLVVHRYVGLAFALIAIVHTYLMIRSQIK